MPDGTVLHAHEVFVHCLPEHIEQRVEIVLDIQYHNRVQIQSELLPSDDFQQFFQGAATTGQGDDGIAQVGHCLFPLVHAFHFHELGKSGVMPSLLHHEAGNDARHLSPCPECRIGHSGHQSHISRTINQANLPLPQQSAQLTGCIEINGIYLCARSTIYAYGIYLVHHLVTSFFRYRHKGT